MERLEDSENLEWDVSMATGITAIDLHHQYLIDTLQEANQRLRENDDAIYLKKFVRNLLGYAIMHFETEESLMQRYGYATSHPEEAAYHIAQHRYFSGKVVAMNEQLREDRKVSGPEVLSFIYDWLHDHVLGLDQSLGKFLNQKMQRTDKEIQ